MNGFHWHRWVYGAITLDLYNTRVELRFCVKCKRLEGMDLPRGESYGWDDYDRCILPAERAGEWHWPSREDALLKMSLT